MNLRPYQIECVERIRQELQGNDSTLAVLATGLGKTVIFSHVAKQWPMGRVLIMAHREELIRQAAAKVQQVTGIQPAIEMGEERADDGGLYSLPPIVVTSVQTMCRPNRLRRFKPPLFGLLVIDEAHHAPANTYRKVIDHYRHNPALKVLGVTATPDRADEAALGQIFSSVAYTYDIPDAIRDGWLVGIEQQFVTVEGLDFANCRTTAGDLNGGDLAELMEKEKALHGVVTPTINLAGDSPTIIFTASVAHAEKVAEILRRHRPGQAVCLHGKSDPEHRRRELQRFAAGDFQYLVNCGLFLEGFDSPRIGVVAVARPTKSRALYAQMIGRGTRALPGVIDCPGVEMEADDRRERIACSSKPSLLVLDFVGNSGRHKLVSTADILGGKYPDEVVERARDEAAAKSAKGERSNMQSELLAAEAKLREQQEARRRHIVAKKAKFSKQRIDPFDVLEITPAREPGWFKGKVPTPKQAEVLQKNGINPDSVSFSEAGQLITEIFQRREKGLCSFKQAKLLAKYGYPTDVGFTEAKAIIDRIAANGWRRAA